MAGGHGGARGQLNPRRVLEIGVGSGLLLAQLAPGVEYWGRISRRRRFRRCRRRWPSSRGVIGCSCGCSPPMWSRGCRRPFRCGGPQLGGPVLPEWGYLLEVVGLAMRLLAPGGALFIGDVRNLSLVEAFTTGVVCADDAYGHSSAAVVRSGSVGRSLPSRSCCWRRSSLWPCRIIFPISRRWMCSSSGCTRSTNSVVIAMRWCCVKHRCRCGRWRMCLNRGGGSEVLPVGRISAIAATA